MVLDEVISEMGLISVVHAKVIDVAAKVVIFTTKVRDIVRPGHPAKSAGGSRVVFRLRKIGPGKVVRRKVAAGASCSAKRGRKGGSKGPC
jgi:hypothetical protein